MYILCIHMCIYKPTINHMFVVQHRISTLHFSLVAKDLRMQFISKRSDKMHLNYFIMNPILIENCFPCKLL